MEFRVYFALFATVILTVGAQIWRCASKRKRGADSREDEDQDEDEVVEDIFISHSGQQKPFVRRLYKALERANHTAFFDEETLKKGARFPRRIKQAARGCKLGVVVLSDGFLRSKWPMLELVLLQKNPNATILPLFYELGPEKLKSLSTWQKIWKRKFPECKDEWTMAVEALGPINGEVFSPGTTEDHYIERVVRKICQLLPSPILYDLSFMKGQGRLAKVVEGHFQKVRMLGPHGEGGPGKSTTCMLGLHGVGGLGKTTICSLMVNFYMSQYLGRSCLMEFPSDGDDKKIVRECQNALMRLTDLSNEQVVSNVRDLNQAVHLMKKYLRCSDVFLAIDNVWESSLEKVKKILEVVFSSKSRVLLTSCSQQVLKELMEGHSNTHVCPLPSPGREEASEIFQETFRSYFRLHGGDFESWGVKRKQLDRVLGKCCFQGVLPSASLEST